MTDIIALIEETAIEAKIEETVLEAAVTVAFAGAYPHTIAGHVDTTATGAELETLTDGSDADALHAHPTNATDSDLSTHDADADAHHAESHDIASHSDTTATGAELETLTDGSETALHSHAGTGSHAATHASGQSDELSHDSLAGVSANDHHNETHTVVSHDTDATGANLDTLTDGSNADALHIHGGVSAGEVAVPVEGITTAQFDANGTLIIYGDGEPITVSGDLDAPTKDGGVWLLIGKDDTNTVTIPSGAVYQTYFSRQNLVFKKGSFLLTVWIKEQSLWKEIFYQY